MCVVFYKKPELHIATEDIEVVKLCYRTKKVWRLFRGRCLKTHGRYRDKSYIIGRTYRNFLKKPENYPGSALWRSDRGLYSYAPNEIPEKLDNKYVFKGVIKKGSHYYYEPVSGTYISNSLKLIE